MLLVPGLTWQVRLVSNFLGALVLVDGGTQVPVKWVVEGLYDGVIVQGSDVVTAFPL